ncbi:MAG: phage holin family protein [Lachnospiraceae bacterium]|nr:phage holin family protein [Lachnospiraceae bacterium]
MKTEYGNTIKGTVTAVFSFLSSLLGILALPVCLMVACNVIDYITGLMAAKYRDQDIKSDIGLRGIVKKVCMWLLVVVGAIVDQVLLYSAETVGIALPFTFLVACVVAIWIICNEIISILENIADIGVELPLFLEKIVRMLKSQVEDKADIDNLE